MQTMLYKNNYYNKVYAHLHKMSEQELYKLLAYYDSMKQYEYMYNYYSICKRVIDDKLREQYC